MRSSITVTKLNGIYSVDVKGKFGGGFYGANGGNTPEKAALFVLAQKARYIDTNKEGGDIFAPEEVRAAIKKLKIDDTEEEGTTRITLRIPPSTYDRIWQIHSETKESINQIIVDILREKLGA